MATATTGCGSSRDEFVYPGGGLQPSQNGSLVFHFEQATAARTVVPTGTVSLRFEFFTEPNAEGTKTVVPDAVRDFASVVRFDSVPVETNSVRITAYGADRLPTRAYMTNVELLGDVVTEVGDIGGGMDVFVDSMAIVPAEAAVTIGETANFHVALVFSNGEPFTVATANGLAWNSSDEEVATITSSGRAASVGVGASTIIADYRGVESTATLTVEPSGVPPGTLIGVTLQVEPETALALGDHVAIEVYGEFAGEVGAREITTDPDFTIVYRLVDEDSEAVLTEAEGEAPNVFVATAVGDVTVSALVSTEGLSEPLVSDEITVQVRSTTFVVYGTEASTDGAPNRVYLPAVGRFHWQILVDEVHPDGRVIDTLLPEDLHYLPADRGVTNVSAAGVIRMSAQSVVGSSSVEIYRNSEETDLLTSFTAQTFSIANVTSTTMLATVDGVDIPQLGDLTLVQNAVHGFEVFLRVATPIQTFRTNVTASAVIMKGGGFSDPHVSFGNFGRTLTVGAPTAEKIESYVEVHERLQDLPASLRFDLLVEPDPTL